MKINKTLILLTFVLSSCMVHAQSKVGIKLYQNTDLFTTEKYYRREKISGENHFNFHRFSVALNIEKKRWSHELEFFIPEIAKDIDRLQFPFAYQFRSDDDFFHGEASTYSLRYELTKTLSGKDKKFSFHAGLALNPYYLHIEYIPHHEFVYYWSTKFYGVAVNISPRMSFRPAARFVVDVSLPLKLYDLRGEKNRVANPAIPISQQTTEDFDSVFLESVYSLRVGLTYVFKR